MKKILDTNKVQITRFASVLGLLFMLWQIIIATITALENSVTFHSLLVNFKVLLKVSPMILPAIIGLLLLRKNCSPHWRMSIYYALYVICITAGIAITLSRTMGSFSPSQPKVIGLVGFTVILGIVVAVEAVLKRSKRNFG